jgi:hypothetical protein
MLRRNPDGKYYTGEGEWTANIEEATKFESIMDVLDVCRKYDLQDRCALVLTIGSEFYDVVHLSNGGGKWRSNGVAGG